MSKKRPEPLEIQHRCATITYLVGKCGGVGSLGGARPPCLPSAEGEETLPDVGRAPLAGVGKSQWLAWISPGRAEGHWIRRCWTLPVGEDAEMGEGAPPG
jgi:hypothetical protein